MCSLYDLVYGNWWHLMLRELGAYVKLWTAAYCLICLHLVEKIFYRHLLSWCFRWTTEATGSLYQTLTQQLIHQLLVLHTWWLVMLLKHQMSSHLRWTTAWYFSDTSAFSINFQLIVQGAFCKWPVELHLIVLCGSSLYAFSIRTIRVDSPR